MPVAGPLATGRPYRSSPPAAGSAGPPGDEERRGEHVPFYYSSKYARLDALPRALDYGKAERLDIVQIYIGYVFDPPDGAGDPVTNAMHLRGACARLLTGKRSENAALLLLNAFSLLAVEASAYADPTPPERPLSENPTVQEATRQYRRAYRRFLEAEPWPQLLSVLAVFSDRLARLHPSLRPLLDGLHQECVLYRTVCLLRDVNRRLLDEPSG